MNGVKKLKRKVETEEERILRFKIQLALEKGGLLGIWKEAQKELLEKIRIEYLTKVNGELRYKELIKSLSLENIKK